MQSEPPYGNAAMLASGASALPDSINRWSMTQNVDSLHKASVAHGGGLAAPYIAMAEAEAGELTHTHYGLEGDLLRFATEKDDTFRVDARDGKRYVLKVANPSEAPQEIDLQLKVLQHIEQVDPSLPVPRVLPDKGGSYCPFVVDRAAQRRQLRLMNYLEGAPLDSTPSSACEREHVGEMLGRLRLAMAGFAHPADSRQLPWDVKHLSALTPLLDKVADSGQQRRLHAGLARFQEIEPALRTLRSQVLHNDFSKSNIVVDHGRPDFVTGIIDFGDTVRTAIAVDVSTALLNQLPRLPAYRTSDDLLADGRDVLRGYLKVADLMHDELALIPHLVMARVVARALITLWRARMFPDNARYILRNTEPGWAQLDWFLSHSIQDISAMLVPSGE